MLWAALCGIQELQVSDSTETWIFSLIPGSIINNRCYWAFYVTESSYLALPPENYLSGAFATAIQNLLANDTKQT